MKHLALIILLSLSTQVMAKTVIEFDESFEAQCYQEIKKHGCTDKAGEPVKKCITSKLPKLSNACRSLFKAQS